MKENKFENLGKLHRVNCEWCEITMGCNCWEGNEPELEGHTLVLCSRCQVTDFLNVIFGAEHLRSTLRSKISQPLGSGVKSTEKKPSLEPKLVLARHRKKENEHPHFKGRTSLALTVRAAETYPNSRLTIRIH